MLGDAESCADKMRLVDDARAVYDGGVFDPNVGGVFNPKAAGEAIGDGVVEGLQ